MKGLSFLVLGIFMLRVYLSVTKEAVNPQSITMNEAVSTQAGSREVDIQSMSSENDESSIEPIYANFWNSIYRYFSSAASWIMSFFTSTSTKAINKEFQAQINTENENSDHKD